MQNMKFIETPTFTRLLTALLTDDEYRALQNVLVENPARGDVIPAGGGIRKLRHALPGAKDNLTDRETALLREFVKDL